MDSLYQFIPDAQTAVIFIVFVFLWSRRTMARDTQNAETIQLMAAHNKESMQLAADCMERMMGILMAAYVAEAQEVNEKTPRK